MVAALGGVEAVVQAMHAHMGDSEVLKQAMRCLILFASDSTASGAILNFNGVQIMLNGMMTHTGNQAVAEQAVTCLARLAVDAVTRVEIAASGGITALVAAANSFCHDNATLAHEYCVTLSRLSTDAGSHNLIVTYALPSLGTILTAYPDHDAVLAVCLTTLAVLATNIESHRQILDRAARSLFGVFDHPNASAATIELCYKVLLSLMDLPFNALKVSR